MFLFLFFSLAVSVQGETKCYDDLGCFSNEGEYGTGPGRLISLFPQSPESINTRFYLYTRDNIDQPQVVSARDPSSILQSHFCGSKNSVFIIHGFRDEGNATWVLDMCKAILQKEDSNCLAVDWSAGAGINYYRTMNNVQVVGAEVAKLIKYIVDNLDSSLSEIHMIGHSLGCHVAGETGKRVSRIGRITCLDAAGSGFEGESTEVRADTSDADFLVSIHTDAGPKGFGMKSPFGHMDFYPNGGKMMPGCDTSLDLDLETLLNPVDELLGFVACNHNFARDIFTYSVLYPDGLMGYCAPDYSSFQEEGAGFPCSGDSCSLMGYYTQPRDSYSCPRYYLNTGPRDNYGRYRYNMIVQTGGNAKFLGSFSVTMYNSDDTKDEHKIYSGYISGGTTYSAFFDGLFPPPIARVTFSYPHSLPLLSKPNLWVESATVIFGSNRAGYRFCADETTRGNDPQTLTPCP